MNEISNSSKIVKYKYTRLNQINLYFKYKYIGDSTVKKWHIFKTSIFFNKNIIIL